MATIWLTDCSLMQARIIMGVSLCVKYVDMFMYRNGCVSLHVHVCGHAQGRKLIEVPFSITLHIIFNYILKCLWGVLLGGEVFVYGCTCFCAQELGSYVGQKKELDPLELKLQVVVSTLT